MKKSLTLIALAAAVLTSCGGQQQSAQEQENETATAMTSQSKNFVFGADKAWTDAGGGVERQIMGYNDDLMMVKVRFDKGDVGSLHSHPHTQCTFVASGKFEFTIGGETHIVEAGDVLYKQPGIEHGCVCLEAGILVDCFSPARETFLEAEGLLGIDQQAE